LTTTRTKNKTLTRKIREQLKIPVVVNGNIRNKEDAEEALKYTGCAAVMSAGFFFTRFIFLSCIFTFIFL
jgi:tRNA-dihydrouridine synthase